MKGGLAFSLENGAAQLGLFFASVGIEERRDTLRITEAETVAQYALSFNEAKRTIVGDRLDELRWRVQEEIASAGALVAHTHSGLFIAGKA